MTQVNSDAPFVTGPASSLANDPTAFADTTGKVLKVGSGGGVGDVVGPASAVSNDIVTFNTTTGKLIKDSGIGIAILSGLLPFLCQGRLTLAPGFPVFAPQAATPSATDTTAETVTFAADPGWPTGTIMTPASTGGGLTLGTQYFFGRLSSVTGAFYASVANANADASRINLTGNVTQALVPSGISQTSINFSPYLGNMIGLYNGSTAWTLLTFSEINLALGTLTNALCYDVFAFNNSGVVAIELLAWTSATARATALVLQDGIYCKTGDTTRRYIGTIYTNATTTTIDDGGGLASAVGGKRFVYNAYNRKQRYGRVKDTTASWSYSTATWRQANGAAGNMCELVQGLSEDVIDAFLQGQASGGSASAESSVSIGIDLTNVPDGLSTIALNTVVAGSVTVIADLPSKLIRYLPVGYHFVSWLERGNGTTTATYYGWDSTNNNRLTGLTLASWQ